MWPDTRGRTSTVSTGSVRPVNSSHSTTSFCSTSATETEGGGGFCEAVVRPRPFETSTAVPIPTANIVSERTSLRDIVSECLKIVLSELSKDSSRDQRVTELNAAAPCQLEGSRWLRKFSWRACQLRTDWAFSNASVGKKR